MGYGRTGRRLWHSDRLPSHLLTGWRPRRNVDREPARIWGQLLGGAVQKENLAARAGRWSARHWKAAVFGWLAFVLVAFYLGMVAGTDSLSVNEPGPGESGRVQRILNDEFEQPAKELVLVQSSSLTAASARFHAAVQDVVRRLEAQPNATNIDSPFAPGNAGRVSSDGHSALVEFDIRGKSEDAKDKVEPILAAVADAQRASPQFTIAEFGGGSANKAINDQFGKDLLKAGAISLPVTLVILLLTFGALVAAGIPLLLALTSVFAAIGLLALPSKVLPMDDAVNAVVLLIGLAVGVDYSMFYLKREREERAAGRTESASVEAAAATSGRSVLISGFTVIVAMAGMFISGDKTFERLRRGDDARRRHFRSRLTDGAAGIAVQARRPREQGPRAVSAQSRSARRREPLLGRDRRAGPAAAAPLRAPSGRRPDRARRAGASPADDAEQHGVASHGRSPSSGPTTRSRRRSPAMRSLRRLWSRLPMSARPESVPRSGS